MAIYNSNLSAVKAGADAFSNLISATAKQKYGYTPMQRNPRAIPPETLYFTIEGEQSIQGDSDVTDQFVEKNEAIQDHVSIKPIIITTTAYVGELTNKIEGVLGEADDFVKEKLQVINQYAPKLTAGATQVLNTVKQTISVAKKAKDAIGNAWDKIQGNDKSKKMTKQQTIADRIQTYWENRTLFLVRTPWKQYDNCIIKSFRTSQPQDTENYSVFDVTFQQIRFVQANFSNKIKSGRNATQSGKATKLGASTPSQAKSSWTDNVKKYASGFWNDAKSAWSA